MTQAANLLQAPAPSANWRAPIMAGYALIAFTFGGLGSWAAVAPLDSAVVAPGAVSVESNRKTIQHLEGGIVREILVRDGVQVREGDTLVRLDPTRTEATEDLYRRQLASALTLEARLVAQRDMASSISFPADVTALSKDPVAASAMHDNQLQFESRRESLLRGLEVVDAQIRQTEQENAQAKADKISADKQLATIDRELPGVKQLWEKGLVALSRMTSLERERLRLEGLAEQAGITLKKGAEKISEARARAEQLRQEYRQDAANQLPDVGKTISDARQQIIIAQDALKRIEIKAPVSGTIQQLRIFTVGGVIKPGDAILDIVPASDTLVVRARVSTVDVDRIRSNAPVEVRLPQFLKFQSEVIRGKVRSISRDSIVDETNRQLPAYFAMEVAVDRSSIPDYINDRLTAGMTTDVVVPTGERTVLQYLVAPLMNRLGTSLRER